jgi:hypothetical protein
MGDLDRNGASVSQIRRPEERRHAALGDDGVDPVVVQFLANFDIDERLYHAVFSVLPFRDRTL